MTPMTKPPTTAATSDCIRPAMAAATAGMTMNVKKSGDMRVRLASRIPLMPAITPEMIQA